ncbi:MAG: LysR family transcriptional regulator [Desulfobacterales bacterium]|nr:LysR family transcriptional regulator [Desulfobacterales bacterium]
MLPDLNRIKVFYYIYTTQSVALAAKELNITPSAVSQTLTKLEAELKVHLFTRLHRKLVPTSTGTQLYHTAAPLIRELEQGVDSILRTREVPSGVLTIGSPIEFGISYFPGVIARFRALYPEVVFSLKLGAPVKILPMVDAGKLDFGLVDIFLTRDQVLGGRLDRYSFEPLLDEEVVLACSRRYYDQEIKGDHSIEKLEELDYISYDRSSLSLRNWFKHHYKKNPGELRRVLTVDSHQAVINAIKNHLGMGVIAAPIVRKEIELGILVPIRTRNPEVINKIALALLQDKVPTLTERTFINFMKQDLADH